MDYQGFLQSKQLRVEPVGIEPGPIHPLLFEWQADIVRWALRRGRAAIFADCGMGKTIVQLEYARQIGRRVLIVAPLAVAQQTIEEAKKIDIEVQVADKPIAENGVSITNYEKLHKFIDVSYDAIVLDESGILKSLDGKTRTLLLSAFSNIPFRLCCTATPAPNDLTELTNHAEFLGAMSRTETLATFFVHDSERSGDAGWRLKGHAKTEFWRWVAQWAVYLRSPHDLGYQDDRFILPELNISEEIVQSDYIPAGHLFPGLTSGITGRTEARKHTLNARVMRSAEIINNSDEQWLVWCGLNDEGKELHRALTGSVLVEGATKDEDKITLTQQWQRGEAKTLISKAKIFGYGLNFQHCHNVLYLGLSDSWEQFYQSIRRCWRFGQKHPVNTVIVTSDAESAIVENIKRKEEQADELAQGIVSAMKDAQIGSVRGISEKRGVYKVETQAGDRWEIKLGDCVGRIKEINTGSVGLSIFSPPFAQLYTYSASERDMGNSKDYDQFFTHFGFLIPELLRVTMPGRRCCVHVQQVALTKVRDGVIGVKDFRADVVEAFVNAGWVYDNEVVIDKDPQSQAIRTKAKSLMFTQLHKDSAWSRPAMADYILLFRAPGENREPIKTDVSNDEWIQWARPIWYGIKESETLNAAVARENQDERHVCPLQLGTIERCLRLWSNRGDLVLSPFAGIGSEGYVALQHERRFVGIELKESYFLQAAKNLQAAVKQESLFNVA